MNNPYPQNGSTLFLSSETPRKRVLVSSQALALAGWVLAMMMLFVATTTRLGFMSCVRTVEAGLFVAAAIGAFGAVGAMRGQRPAPLTMLIAAQAALTAVAAVTGYVHQRMEPSPYANLVYGGTPFGPLQLGIDQAAAIAVFALLAYPPERSPMAEHSRNGFRVAVQVAACCVVLLASLQFITDRAPGMRIDGGLSNPNLLGSFLALCWPLFAARACLEWETPRTKRIALTAAAAILLTALWFTGSRGAFIGAGVSALIIGMAFVVRRLPRIPPAILAAACGLILICGAAVVLRHADSIGGISHERSDQQRLVVWRAACLITRARPVLGVGLGGFPAAMMDLKLREANPATPTGLPTLPAIHLHAHNILLQYAAERGIPALAVLLALIAALAARTVWLVGVRRGAALGPSGTKDAASNAFAVGAAAAIAGLLAQNLFDYTLWYAPLLILAWGLGGWVAATVTTSENSA